MRRQRSKEQLKHRKKEKNRRVDNVLTSIRQYYKWFFFFIEALETKRIDRLETGLQQCQFL